MTEVIRYFIFGPSLHILYFSHSHCYTSSESQKAQVPRSLTDAVAKHKKDHPKKGSISNAGSDKTGKGVDSKVKKDEKSTKTFKKKTDGEKKFRKEAKVPMTPAERRASKPNFALVRLLYPSNIIFMGINIMKLCLIEWNEHCDNKCVSMMSFDNSTLIYNPPILILSIMIFNCRLIYNPPILIYASIKFVLFSHNFYRILYFIHDTY